MVGGQPEQLPVLGGWAEEASTLDGHHVGANRLRDGPYTLRARPADDLKRIEVVEVGIVLGKVLRAPQVGPAAVVANQLGDAPALGLGTLPDGMRGPGRRPTLASLDVFFMAVLDRPNLGGTSLPKDGVNGML